MVQVDSLWEREMLSATPSENPLSWSDFLTTTMHEGFLDLDVKIACGAAIIDLNELVAE